MFPVSKYFTVSDTHNQFSALNDAFDSYFVGNKFTTIYNFTFELNFINAKGSTFSRASAPAEEKSYQLPHGIKAKASGHYRIAGEMAGKKPQIRGYIKFSLNKTKTMFSAIIIYMGNSIKHQHIGGGKLAVAGTEQFAAAAG